MAKLFNRDIRVLNAAIYGGAQGNTQIVSKAGRIVAPLSFSASTPIYDTSGNELVKFVVTASAVNEVTITNGATGSGPTISATGDDSNIDITISPKGTGKVVLGSGSTTGVCLFQDQPIMDSGSNELIKFSKASNAVNEVTLGNAATAGAPSVAATGDDTNIDLQLSSKGTGTVKLGTSATATASAGAATASGQRFQVTTESLVTAAGSTYTLTLTNTQITASSIIIARALLGSSTQGQPLIEKITPGSGSATIVVRNIHASLALNGTLIISGLVL